MFGELLRTDYGPPTYATPFWSFSYYRHWKHGDLLVEKYGPRFHAKDFATLRAKYTEQLEALTTLREERGRVAQAWERVAALLRKREEAKRGLETIVDRHTQDIRARVRAHLEPLDDERLAQLLAHDEAGRTAAARVSGVRAKRVYLEKMHEQMVKAPREDIRRAILKNERDVAKLTRPKNYNRTMPREVFERRYKDRRPAWQKRRARYVDTTTHIVHFHDYGRWNPVSDFLWWDVMTDGRLDGDFIPEVQYHHATYGRYDQAAAAYVEEQSTSSSDRFVDAS
jgi:hypothetical protein